MASAKLGGKKQDEKNLKLLREMAALASNRHCFECGQRGPTYVNMTIGTFICTACSGVLRGLNPPHRVKSISMASFTPEEIDFLKEHGNEYNRHVWLGLHDSKSPPSLEPSEEHKLRDYLAQKYERKRWYMEPTTELKEQAKAWNTIAAAGASADASGRPRTGSSLGPAPAASTGASAVAGPAAALRLQPPVGAAPSTSIHGSAAPAPVAVAPQSSGDLLSDLFAAPAPSTNPAIGSFGASAAVFPSMPAVASQPNQPMPFSQAYVPPAKASVLLSGNSPQHTGMLHAGGASSAGAVKPPGLSGTASAGGDKYAALADLFETSSSTQPTSVHHNESAVNWNSINWGAAPSVASSSSGGVSYQKPPAFSVGSGAGGWSSAPLSAAPAMSSWQSGAHAASSLVAPGLPSFSLSQGAAPAFPASSVPWAGMQPAAAAGQAPANPFLSTAAVNPAQFAAFPSATGGMAQGKLAAGGSFAVQGPSAAVPPLQQQQQAGGPFAQRQQHAGFAGGMTGLGPAQPPAVFQAQSGLFGQPPASHGGMQVQASVGPQQQQNGGWASWTQQARPAEATHSANPFASTVGSTASGNMTNPFL